MPEDHLLGERGQGYSQFLSILDDGRVAIAALALGCIRACLELSRRYALQRTVVRRTDRPQTGRSPSRSPIWT